MRKSGIIKDNDPNTFISNTFVSQKVLPVKIMEATYNAPIIDNNIKTLPIIYLNDQDMKTFNIDNLGKVQEKK